ncbi:MAG: M23 family metallopeptidase [Candidatus Aminicenantes bacterium]|nr:MAG: M23 family metallopeptidase [Candidatus Aminicenantes bacterium]
MRKNIWLFITTAILLFCISVVLQPQEKTFVPIDVDVPFPPSPVKCEREVHFLYELHITNFSSTDMRLLGLEVIGKGKTDRSLGIYKDKSLKDLIYLPGTPMAKDKQVISGGKRAIVTLWLTIEGDKTVPSHLAHHLWVQYSNWKKEEVEETLDAGLIEVRQFTPPVLGPPLESGEWITVPHNIIGRRAVIALDGKARAAQRYGMDLMKFGPDGKLVSGDKTKNENWYGFGAKLIAVADGVVSYVHDGEPENVPYVTPKRGTLTRENVGGNIVILDIGDGIYAVYAHVKQNSIQVEVGEMVKKGQVLAELGNTGNSGGPHLHFHVVDQNMVLAAEGIPYVFESFEIMRKLDLNDVAELYMKLASWKSEENPKPDKRRMETPLNFYVIRFSVE